MPHLFTVVQKQHAPIQSVDCNCFNTTKRRFLCKYVTMDETWIHHFILESNRQSAVWTAGGENHPKQLKKQTSAGKVLTIVFWDAQGILFINYLEKGITINSEYYIALLVHLKKEIAKKRPQMKKKKCSFTKTMYCVASQLQWWQNYINCTSNCFRTHPILQIWPPATTGCLQTSKECSKERDLAAMKKWYLQWRSDIWGQRQIILQKRHQIVREVLESVYHPKRRLCWWKKSNFF